MRGGSANSSVDCDSLLQEDCRRLFDQSLFFPGLNLSSYIYLNVTYECYKHLPPVSWANWETRGKAGKW